LLLVDKPDGPTSHDVVDAVREVLGVARIGHAGTLDPFASGLLVLLVGRATRLVQYLVSLPKTYRGTIRLGVATDTDDRSGTPTATSEDWRSLDDADVAHAMGALTGSVMQRPPAFSAKKLDGARAYRLARQGKAVSLAARSVQVHRFHLMRRDGSAVEFECDVSGGTYVRALARDLGEGLRCGAHLETLRRTAVGPFQVEDAVSMDDLPRATAAHLLPPLAAVSHLPRLDLAPDDRTRVTHGQPLEAPAIEGAHVALVSDGGLVAVAERAGAVLKPRTVVADD
jgi:tRNA pseudouridine55 synthase